MASIMVSKEDKEIFDIFRRRDAENGKYDDIAVYLMKKYRGDLFIDDALEIAIVLNEQMGLSYEQIASGNYDEKIDKYVKYYAIRKNAVKQENEQLEDLPLESKKKSTKGLNFVKGAVFTIAAVGLIFAYKLVDAKRQESDVTGKLGKLASEYGSYEYQEGMSIVAQNTFRVYDKYTKDSTPAYHNDQIALDIIAICNKDPQLFDICMNNVYNEMSYNRLDNMDEVLRCLQGYMATEPALEHIYNRISNEKVFLDYVIDRGFADPNSDSFYKLMGAIEKYKANDYGNSFMSLSEEDQKYIESLMNNYANNNKNLYKEYADDITKLANEQEEASSKVLGKGGN